MVGLCSKTLEVKYFGIQVEKQVQKRGSPWQWASKHWSAPQYRCQEYEDICEYQIIFRQWLRKEDFVTQTSFLLLFHTHLNTLTTSDLRKRGNLAMVILCLVMLPLLGLQVCHMMRTKIKSWKMAKLFNGLIAINHCEPVREQPRGLYTARNGGHTSRK